MKNLRNEISNFQQWFDESFHEAWDRYKDFLHVCPHHGFIELNQIDTFYSPLNPAEQDSLNSAAGGNLLERRTHDVLTIIENKSKTSNALHNAIMEAGGKDRPPMLAPVTKGGTKTTTERYMENYKNVSQDIRDQLNAKAEAVQIILTGIDNDIYSTVDACPNACEMWKAIERFKQGESINVQDLKPICIGNLENSHPGMVNHLNGITQEWQRSQQAATRNRDKAIVNSPPPIYDQEPFMVAKDDEMSKDKEIDKLMALISLSFKKIYKPTNNNLRTSSDTSTTVVQKSRIQCYNCMEYGHVAREYQKPKRAKDVAYHKEKMLLCKQHEAGFQLNTEQADWKDDTDDEPKDQELEAHYMYMAQIQEVNPDTADNSGPIFDTEILQNVSNNDNYNVFSIESEHPEEQIDQNDDDDLSNESDLLASLIEKLKYEIDDNKNRIKFLETSNKALVNKLKVELDKYHDVKYASKVEIDCAKAKGDLMSYKIESEKSFNEYTRQINDLNQMILEMKKELFAHQEIISIMTQQKEAQIKFYKTREDKEIDKVIALENKVKVLDNIVYKTDQSVQTMNMLNGNCKASFAKPEFLKKARRANPRLYDIGCNNDNVALMLAPESDEVIRLEKKVDKN
nr:reverse transcriptase domain-containing protein [Tanacetum cinerariifolium]